MCLSPLLELACEIHATHAGHVDVCDDEIKRPFGKDIQGLFGTRSPFGIVTQALQHAADELEIHGYIVHYEDAEGAFPGQGGVQSKRRGRALGIWDGIVGFEIKMKTEG